MQLFAQLHPLSGVICIAFHKLVLDHSSETENTETAAVAKAVLALTFYTCCMQNV